MMDCQKARSLYSELIDDQLSASDKDEILAHLEHCSECQAEFVAAEAMSSMFSAIPNESLPDDFGEKLHAALKKENMDRPRRRPVYKSGWFKGIAAVACLLLLIGVGSIVFDGIGLNETSSDMAQSSDSAMMDIDGYDIAAEEGYDEYTSYGNDIAAYPSDTKSSVDNGSVDGNSNISADIAPMERKIIKDAYLSLKVDDFETSYRKLQDMAVSFGGYVVSCEIYSTVDDVAQEGYLSLRVDSSRLDEALSFIDEIGTISSQSYSTNDVTSEYYDIAGRLEQYQAQEDRLMELYAKAESIDDLISLENEITRVQVEIDSLQGMINYYDQLTALSLISINLYTPSKYVSTVEPQGFIGFWQDIKEAFFNGINGLLDGIAAIVVFCVRISPVLIIAVVLVALVIKRFRKKRKMKNNI